ncbi:MAG: hypothetical protein KC609_07315 [Myxococcales bacterium]|nr:hypothetical protein [Myxococcales bacterium]
MVVSNDSKERQVRHAAAVPPGSYQYEKHFYPRVLNAQLHPLVSFFLNLSNERIIHRYCHLNPQVIPPVLDRVLRYQPQYFHWAGSDLFNVTTETGDQQMVVIETNSCPSGQKSMPLLDENQEQGGYGRLMRDVFLRLTDEAKGIEGGLAMVYDKNPMETTGYAAAMADVMHEPVWLVEFYDNDPNPPVRFENGLMHVRDAEGAWHPIRAAMRYVTQRPWSRIPPMTRTVILNPVLACLAGGRNKLVAAKAYDLYNAELSGTGLQIKTPYTIRDVRKVEIPLWMKSLGGYGVIKVPYSNAGQGVYTITNERELDEFMERDYKYDQFIVQSLVGNSSWSSRSGTGRYYHVGTLPSKKLNIFVADLRMMLCSTGEGFRPLAIYARRSRLPLTESLDGTENSWDMLGTNLSIKKPDGTWDTDTQRLMLMDRKDFNTLGFGVDDLIKGFIQTILSVIAIDKMATTLVTKKGKFRRKLYRSLNTDEVLLNEIIE